MPNIDLIVNTVKAIDVLAFPTIFIMWLVFKRASGAQKYLSPRLLALPFVFALIYGLVWSYYPPLRELRFTPLPKGQGAAILVLILSLLSLFLIPAWRTYFKNIDTKHLVYLGPWRILYGALLLLLGLNGGLPFRFFWSASFGDILAGLWAVSIIQRKLNVSTGELYAYNIFGLFDFFHVLALAAVFFMPFFNAHSQLPSPNLLPFAMVPLFIWVHIISLYALRAQQKELKA
jgi:hypothetical protein